MPRPVLKTVAALLALIALAALVMGLLGSSERGRLPGERGDDEAGGVAPVQATDATPLVDERIEGPPPPKELTPEEKAKLEEEQKAKEAQEAAKAEPAAAPTDKAATPAKPSTPPSAAGDRVGDLLDGVTPPPADEPPH